MKFSKRCDNKYKPWFFVEDMNGKEISEYGSYSFGEMLQKAREMSCYTRGGCRVGVAMATFKIVGGRIQEE